MNKKSAVTIGAFDGVHKGHQFLISETVNIAACKGLKSVIVVLERPVKKV
ncbi:MAG: riboflavin biosynthesis protein RibF, partial [Endomicrobia bacterium]|nr:riboflavin biosynthesis protein RibF [Endomicrobiia bacterium]